MKFSKLNRVTHRDLGYIIAGMTIIYALSGIALNHKHDWNPNYIFDSRTFTAETPITRETFGDDTARDILKQIGLEKEFKASYFPSGNKATIFINGGYVTVNAATGGGVVERISKRPLFYQVNFLHYNPGVWWKYFSDIYCVALILVTITGLFILKGRNGITKRGAILTLAGVLLPVLFLFIYN
jgi:uncharacterized protein